MDVIAVARHPRSPCVWRSSALVCTCLFSHYTLYIRGIGSCAWKHHCGIWISPAIKTFILSQRTEK